MHFDNAWDNDAPSDPFEFVKHAVQLEDTPPSDARKSPPFFERSPSIPEKKGSPKRTELNETPERLSSEEQGFLSYVAEHPGFFVTQIYAALKLSGYKGDKIKEALIAKGFLTQKETRLGGGGRLAKTLTLTPAGIKVRTGVPPGKGGDLHKQIQRMIKEQAELFGWKAKIEERIAESGESVDVGLTKDDLAIGVEISVTTDADNEIRNIQKCLAAGYDYVICAVSEDTTLKALKTKGRRIFPPQERCRIRYSSPSRFKSVLQEIAGPVVVSAPTGVFSPSRNQNQLLGTKEAAVLLGVSTLTLYTWVSQRRIPHIKVGRLTKFKRDDLTTWLERRTKVEERWNS
jgi:excisionase family DNA binding protein